MKREILFGTVKSGKFVFEITIKINGKNEQTFVFPTRDVLTIEQTNSYFIVYYKDELVMSIKLSSLDYVYTGWRVV